MSLRPRVVLVGGPDVDARLDLMCCLRDDFEVSAMGSNSALKNSFVAEGFIYHAYHLNRKVSPIADVLTLRQLVSTFRAIGPDIVHAFDTKPGVWGCLAARLAGVPVIIGTSTGLGSLYNSDELKTRILWKVYQMSQTLACSVSDLTIFQNHVDRSELVTLGVVPQRKTKVILGSGVATDYFSSAQVTQEKRSQLRRELNIRPDDVVVTMISRVMRSKGVLEFMSAAQKIRFRYPDAHFLLVGPVEKESLDSLDEAELAELKQNVSWPGARNDVAAILAISDIFVLPTQYREGIPRVLLEAAAMELPIVTTDAPGCSEIVEHGVNGWLVPGQDLTALTQAILSLIEKPELRQQFGQKSRERVMESFSLKVIAGQTRAVYEQLLAQKATYLKEFYRYQTRFKI